MYRRVSSGIRVGWKGTIAPNEAGFIEMVAWYEQLRLVSSALLEPFVAGFESNSVPVDVEKKYWSLIHLNFGMRAKSTEKKKVVFARQCIAAALAKGIIFKGEAR